MSNTIHKEYISRLDQLALIAKEINQRIISGSDGELKGELFYKNANFFTKALLTTMCAYLESYLKDALMEMIDKFNQRLSTARLPHALVIRSLGSKPNNEPKNNNLANAQFRININRKDLDFHISGNPYKTKTLFEDFGINLDGDEIFLSQKEGIELIVNKRNKIMHHGDEASDVSGDDLINNIQLLTEYIKNVDALICKHLEQ